MGIFNKIKNFITGGGVVFKITFINKAQLSKPFKIGLELEVKTVDIKADAIEILIEYTEIVELEINTIDSKGRPISVHEKKAIVLFKEIINIEKMVLLEADSVYSYETEIVLPEGSMPSIEGKNAKMIWTVQALIHKSGNNPESKKLRFDPIYQIS